MKKRTMLCACTHLRSDHIVSRDRNEPDWCSVCYNALTEDRIRLEDDYYRKYRGSLGLTNKEFAELYDRTYCQRFRPDYLSMIEKLAKEKGL